MKTRKTLQYLFYCFALVVTLSACSSEMEEINNLSEEKVISSFENDVRIIQSLGFDTLNIIEMDSYYLVEGDIMFKKSELSSYKVPQTRQAYHTTGLVGHPKQRSITVGVASSIPSSGVDNWRTEIQEAIELWNPLSNIKMTYTLAANPDILISSDAGALPNYAIASASWPSNGKPGSSIVINLDYYNNKTVPSLQKKYNMVHELGHCLALRHTNWRAIGESGANHISGTPETDPYSMMNGGTAENLWNGFSEGDKKAIEKLYPFFSASLQDFPKHLSPSVPSWWIDSVCIGVKCSHPITSYSWWVSAGKIYSQNKTSPVIVAVPLSPISFSVGVIITTIYGETYSVYQIVGGDSTCRPYPYD